MSILYPVYYEQMFNGGRRFECEYFCEDENILKEFVDRVIKKIDYMRSPRQSELYTRNGFHRIKVTTYSLD